MRYSRFTKKRFYFTIIFLVIGVMTVANFSYAKWNLVNFNKKEDPTPKKKYPYYLSVCAIFRDEGSILKEWIEYHQLVGVEHFYLYNNNSSDNYLQVLEPYIKAGIVELQDWPTPTNVPWSPYQTAAYNHWLSRNKMETFWVAIIDLDEFIVPVDTMTIPEFLKDFEEFGGVYFLWHIFGTSNLPSIPENQLLIESLTLKKPWKSSFRHCGKSIVRPEVVKKIRNHRSKYKKGFFTVTCDGKRTKISHLREPPPFERIRINHYHYRAEDFFFTQRIGRMERKNGRKYSKEEIAKIRMNLSRYNQEKDITIFKYVKALRKRMGMCECDGSEVRLK